MIIKILSPQIPAFWDAIKFTVRSAEPLNDESLQPVYNDLLQALLSDKAQCFVSVGSERRLRGLILSRVMMDTVTDEVFLMLGSLYAWDKITDEEYKEGHDLIMRFARKQDCKYIAARTSNLRTMEIANNLGFREKYRMFEVRL